MAQVITDKNRQEFLKTLESLRHSYINFDGKKNKSPIQIAAVAESEEDFVKEGLVPYLQNIIAEATELLRIPVTLRVDFQPGKNIQISAEAKKKNNSATPSNNLPKPPAPVPPPPKFRPAPLYKTKSTSKAPPTGLRVNIGTDTVIHEFYASDTFAQAIAYAMEKVGTKEFVDTISSRGPYLDNAPLVKRGMFTHPEADNHEVGLGYYTNTHSNNPTKKRQLEAISDMFNLHWRISILEKRH